MKKVRWANREFMLIFSYEFRIQIFKYNFNLINVQNSAFSSE